MKEPTTTRTAKEEITKRQDTDRHVRDRLRFSLTLLTLFFHTCATSRQKKGHP